MRRDHGIHREITFDTLTPGGAQPRSQRRVFQYLMRASGVSGPIAQRHQKTRLAGHDQFVRPRDVAGHHRNTRGHGLHHHVGQALEAAGKLKVFANVFYKSDQGDGGPALGLFFFGSDDCGGASLGFPLSVAATGADSWQTLTAQQEVPEGSHSALVRLAVTKPLRSLVFKASFDNILVRTEP